MKKDLKKKIAEEIKRKDVKIRSKNFFKFLKIVGICALAVLGVIAVFVFNLSFYLPKRGFVGSRIFPVEIFASLPWLLVILGALIIGLLIYIYIKYEGGYKRSLLWTIILITIGIVFLGALVSVSRLNERLEEKPRMQRLYDWGESNFVPGSRRRLHREFPHLPSPQRNMKYFLR